MKRKPQNKHWTEHEPMFEETLIGKIVLTAGFGLVFWCVAVLFEAF